MGMGLWSAASISMDEMRGVVSFFCDSPGQDGMLDKSRDFGNGSVTGQRGIRAMVTRFKSTSMATG